MGTCRECGAQFVLRPDLVESCPYCRTLPLELWMPGAPLPAGVHIRADTSESFVVELAPRAQHGRLEAFFVALLALAFAFYGTIALVREEWIKALAAAAFASVAAIVSFALFVMHRRFPPRIELGGGRLRSRYFAMPLPKQAELDVGVLRKLRTRWVSAGKSGWIAQLSAVLQDGRGVILWTGISDTRAVLCVEQLLRERLRVS